MLENDKDIRDRFKERVLPLLPALARTARIAFGDDKAAERTFEETITNAYREYSGNLSDGEFRLWLFGKLIGVLMPHGKENPGNRPVSSPYEGNDPTRVQPHAEDPETLRSLRIRVKHDLNAGDVREVIRTLPVSVRTAIALAMGGGLTPDEMAPVLNVPASAARASVNEGRRLLRRGLCEILHERPSGLLSARQNKLVGSTLQRS